MLSFKKETQKPFTCNQCMGTGLEPLGPFVATHCNKCCGEGSIEEDTGLPFTHLKIMNPRPTVVLCRDGKVIGLDYTRWIDLWVKDEINS